MRRCSSEAVTKGTKRSEDGLAFEMAIRDKEVETDEQSTGWKLGVETARGAEEAKDASASENMDLADDVEGRASQAEGRSAEGTAPAELENGTGPDEISLLDMEEIIPVNILDFFPGAEDQKERKNRAYSKKGGKKRAGLDLKRFEARAGLLNHEEVANQHRTRLVALKRFSPPRSRGEDEGLLSDPGSLCYDPAKVTIHSANEAAAVIQELLDRWESAQLDEIARLFERLNGFVPARSAAADAQLDAKSWYAARFQRMLETGKRYARFRGPSTLAGAETVRKWKLKLRPWPVSGSGASESISKEKKVGLKTTVKPAVTSREQASKVIQGLLRRWRGVTLEEGLWEFEHLNGWRPCLRRLRNSTSEEEEGKSWIEQKLRQMKALGKRFVRRSRERRQKVQGRFLYDFQLWPADRIGEAGAAKSKDLLTGSEKQVEEKPFPSGEDTRKGSRGSLIEAESPEQVAEQTGPGRSHPVLRESGRRKEVRLRESASDLSGSPDSYSGKLQKLGANGRGTKRKPEAAAENPEEVRQDKDALDDMGAYTKTRAEQVMRKSLGRFRKEAGAYVRHVFRQATGWAPDEEVLQRSNRKPKQWYGEQFERMLESGKRLVRVPDASRPGGFRFELRDWPSEEQGSPQGSSGGEWKRKRKRKPEKTVRTEKMAEYPTLEAIKVSDSEPLCQEKAWARISWTVVSQ
jgi:hypothetical protein